MNSLIFNQDFPHDYEVQQLEELPQGRKAFFFPSPRRKHDSFAGIIYPPRLASYKLTLSVIPSARKPWIGNFIPGRSDSAGLSALFSCPNPRHLCVIANGWAYIVDTQQPSKEIDVDIENVSRVDACLPHGLLILSNQTFISAWGHEGLVWEIWDFDETNFEKITNITDDTIHVTTSLGTKSFLFEIDIASGEYRHNKQDFEPLSQTLVSDDDVRAAFQQSSNTIQAHPRTLFSAIQSKYLAVYPIIIIVIIWILCHLLIKAAI